MSSRVAFAAAVVLAAAVCIPVAGASRGMKVGFTDTGVLYDDPARTFPVLKQLRTQVLRVNLYWGGRAGVARRRPGRPTNPADQAYVWAPYDRIVANATRNGIRVVFSIWGTPGWANGGAGFNRAPRRASDLRAFAYAAATRYSGTYETADGEVIPAVRHWLAWNEPNYSLGLLPQYRRVRGRWVIQSALDYAKICNAIYEGVHATLLEGEKVACGATGPRGNNNPRAGQEAKISPLAFLRALKKAGVKRFDAYAHHPYSGLDTPAMAPRSRMAVTLGNIDALSKELTRLYGPKRIWITEYGYQTSPPDPFLGVSWARQASYLRQAFALARRHPRIDMMLWFLVRDEPQLSGWQSGLITSRGQRKPAFNVFRSLPR